MSYSGAETSETFNHVHGNVSAADLPRNIHSYRNFQDFFILPILLETKQETAEQVNSVW